jgi:Icc protein
MAATDAAQPIRLLHLSDTHLHAAADSRMRGVVTAETLRDVLARARASDAWPPAGVLVTGDIVQDESRAGYERFRATMMPLGAPIYCLPGNHDDPALMDQMLDRAPFQVGGDVRLGGWSLVLLSTFLAGEDAGGLGERRLRGLEAALTAHRGQHVLVAMHHQPLPMGSAWLDGVGLRDADAFLRVIDAHSNVRGVVWGHVHQASDRDRNGVRYLSTPSTCAQFKPRSDFFALDRRGPGFRWLELFPDGRIGTEVTWLDGVADDVKS